jgi:hypothetical protein
MYGVDEVAIDLAARGIIPSELQRPIRVVNENRNALVHGGAEVKKVAKTASTLAIDVLLKVREIKRNYYRIARGQMSVFGDRELSKRVDTNAVMVEQLDNEGNVVATGVYPTVHEYRADSYVSWEWYTSRVFQEPAWYLDQGGAVREAWGSAASFDGKPYPDEWGISDRIGSAMRLR